MPDFGRIRRDIETLKESVSRLRLEYERARTPEQRKAFLPQMRWCADELAALLAQMMAYDLTSVPSTSEDEEDRATASPRFP